MNVKKGKKKDNIIGLEVNPENRPTEKMKDGRELIKLNKAMKKNPTNENVFKFLVHLIDSHVLIPCTVKLSEDMIQQLKDDSKDDVQTDENSMEVTPVLVKGDNGETYLPIFSQEDQINREWISKEYTDLWIPMSGAIEIYRGRDKELQGIVLDPHTLPAQMDESVIATMERIIKDQESQ